MPHAPSLAEGTQLRCARALRAACAAAFVIASAFIASPASATSHQKTGSVSGTFTDGVDEQSVPDLRAASEAAGLSVTTNAGVTVGHLHFGDVTATADRHHTLDYTIDGLPLGVPLSIAAARRSFGVPSPVPSGFFRMVQLQQKTYGPYTTTLTKSQPRAGGFDFTFGSIEVVPALPNPPSSASPNAAPSPSATSSPSAPPTAAGSTGTH